MSFDNVFDTINTPQMTVEQTTTYRVALRAARDGFDTASARLRKIRAEAAELEDEIGRLRRTITALSALCAESPGLDPLGITDSVAFVMEIAPGTMTTNDVVHALDSMGFDLATQKNAAASVHAILARLASAEKITKVAEHGKVSWRGPKHDPDYDEIQF